MANRYEYLQLLAPKITDELVITGIGGVNWDWYNLNDRDGNLYHLAMSTAPSVAFGLALALPHRGVICLEGEGSILMGLPILPDIAQQNPSNLIVIVFDNESYESASGPAEIKLPSHTAGSADLVEIARGAGIRNAKLVERLHEFQDAIDDRFQSQGTTFLLVKVECGPQTPPPALDGPENKYRFIRYVERTENISLIRDFP